MQTLKESHAITYNRLVVHFYVKNVLLNESVAEANNIIKNSKHYAFQKNNFFSH